MPFRNPAITVLTLLLTAAAVPSVSTAQDEEQAVFFIQLDCMKSTSSDYGEVETEIWQPMHQEMVKQNKRFNWSLYWVLFGDRSECDYYTVNTFRGLEQLNAEWGYAEVFATVHPGKNWDEAMARTNASRTLVRTELWVWVDGVPPADHRYAMVNQMLAEDRADFLEYEQETWKPIHQALVDGGHRAGWGVYELVSPVGSSLPYNFSTVDFLKQLGPAPVEETMRSVHPDQEITAIFQDGEDARDHVLGETWMLIASTQPEDAASQ